LLSCCGEGRLPIHRVKECAIVYKSRICFCLRNCPASREPKSQSAINGAATVQTNALTQEFLANGKAKEWALLPAGNFARARTVVVFERTEDKSWRLPSLLTSRYRAAKRAWPSARLDAQLP
jgi:hypothetical protein